MKAMTAMVVLVISASVLTIGCGGEKKESAIDKGIKNTVETGLKVVKKVDDLNNIGSRASVMKEDKTYARFELLQLGIPYQAALAVMTSLPSRTKDFGIVDAKICSWDLENNATIECEFRNNKLFRKVFKANHIHVKEPFTKAQFNRIGQNDIYITTKEKLNKQDGYLCEQMVSMVTDPFNTYMWRNPDGSAAIVQFAGTLFIKKEYIDAQKSGAVPSATVSNNNDNTSAKSTSDSAGNQQIAITGFTILPAFHKAITTKQYQTAYNYLGPEMQNYVGGYDKFVNGYATTISSKVRDMNVLSDDSNSTVIEYILEAKDRINGGIVEQSFKGTATMKKINGNWRIVENTAKRISYNNSATGNLSGNRTGVITATEVRMRQYNNTTAEIIGYFNKGERVSILDSSNGWYKVRRSDNSIGWVMGDYCKPQ